MTAYFRKAFTFGPFRLNLSKSGLGLSVGITGLRVGVGPTGPYFHAGRGGLYFRKSLKEVQNSPNEFIEEEVIEPTEPQPIWKKILILLANIFVASIIISLLIFVATIYFIIYMIKPTTRKKRRK